jgi:D-hydroxyproline dehydrogenase subunit beta
MYDLIIIGAGALGTFHAYHAAKAGLQVMLLEKDAQPAGATVRNFGQVVPSGLAGRWFEHGRRSLAIYRELQSQTDLTVRQNGTVYVASDEAEWQLAHELHDHYRLLDYPSELLSAAQCLARYPALRPEYVVGGLYFGQEVSVEPDQMIHRLIGYLRERYRITYRAGLAVVDCQRNYGGAIVTLANRERFEAGRVLVCSGHEMRLLFPDILEEAGLTVSKLQMLQTQPLTGVGLTGHSLPGNVLTGLTIRRYEAFQQCPSYAAMTTPEHLQELKRWGIHILFKQALDGSFILGDSHEYASATEAESLGFDTQQHINELMLTEARRIVQFPIQVRRAWAGFYSQTPKEIFEYDVDDHVRIITGIGGKGMTSSAGYAEQTIKQFA